MPTDATGEGERRRHVRKFQTGVWCAAALIALAAAIGSAVKGIWFAAAILLAFAAGMAFTARRISIEGQPHSFMTALLAPKEKGNGT